MSTSTNNPFKSGITGKFIIPDKETIPGATIDVPSNSKTVKVTGLSEKLIDTIRKDEWLVDFANNEFRRIVGISYDRDIFTIEYPFSNPIVAGAFEVVRESDIIDLAINNSGSTNVTVYYDGNPQTLKPGQTIEPQKKFDTYPERGRVSPFIVDATGGSVDIMQGGGLDYTTGGAGGSGATEATLQSLLQAVKDHQDFELKLVRDEGNGDKVVCEVAEYDEETDSYSYTYKDVGGAPYTPTTPLVYLDPEAVLNLLITETQKLTDQKTPTSFTTTTNQTIPVGATEISIFNNGASNITVNGVVTPPGVKREFGFKNPIDTTIDVVPGGEQVLIDYMA